MAPAASGKKPANNTVTAATVMPREDSLIKEKDDF